MKEKTPIYKQKKWWGILIIVMAVLYFIGTGMEDDEQKTDEKPNGVVKQDDPVEETKEEPKENTVRVDKEIELNNVQIEIQTVTIENGKVTIPIWWSHWATNEKAHLSLFVYPSVYQGDEQLEMTDGEDTLLKQKNKGIDDRAVVEYELIDDETPIEIKFIETTDEAKEESISVDID